MLEKKLQVNIKRNTWPGKPPAWTSPSTLFDKVDVVQALLMLGSLTTPSGLSPGSPERYWACMRYFSACTSSSDLRVSAPFMELDPHQKGILSDDFGVAISTAWLTNRLGGIRSIVDGRKFMINMGIKKLNASPSKRLAKVGPTKCPDYVLEDTAGKFHVLECKGTQSGTAYLAKAMKTGQVQKRGIKIAKPLRGDRLVIGLSLAGEGEAGDSELVVIDPEDEPLTEVRESDQERAEEVLGRLTLARALNLTGFSRTASEIAWPESLQRTSPELALLTPAEIRRTETTERERREQWEAELKSEFSQRRPRTSQEYVTQQMTFDIPTLRLDSGDPVSRVTVSRGVKREVLEQLASAGADMRDAARSLVEPKKVRQAAVKFKDADHFARLEYQNLFFSQIDFE